MLLVIASLAVLFLAPATGQGLVKVGFYGEALCPDCINFINGPLTVAFKEVYTRGNVVCLDRRDNKPCISIHDSPRLLLSSFSTTLRGEMPSLWMVNLNVNMDKWSV